MPPPIFSTVRKPVTSASWRTRRLRRTGHASRACTSSVGTATTPPTGGLTWICRVGSGRSRRNFPAPPRQNHTGAVPAARHMKGIRMYTTRTGTTSRCPLAHRPAALLLILCLVGGLLSSCADRPCPSDRKPKRRLRRFRCMPSPRFPESRMSRSTGIFPSSWRTS